MKIYKTLQELRNLLEAKVLILEHLISFCDSHAYGSPEREEGAVTLAGILGNLCLDRKDPSLLAQLNLKKSLLFGWINNPANLVTNMISSYPFLNINLSEKGVLFRANYNPLINTFFDFRCWWTECIINFKGTSNILISRKLIIETLRDTESAHSDRTKNESFDFIANNTGWRFISGSQDMNQVALNNPFKELVIVFAKEFVQSYHFYQNIEVVERTKESKKMLRLTFLDNGNKKNPKYDFSCLYHPWLEGTDDAALIRNRLGTLSTTAIVFSSPVEKIALKSKNSQKQAVGYVFSFSDDSRSKLFFRIDIPKGIFALCRYFNKTYTVFNGSTVNNHTDNRCKQVDHFFVTIKNSNFNSEEEMDQFIGYKLNHCQTNSTTL